MTDDLANQVKVDIENRIIKGVQTYGERLRPNNGRIALQDAYEEVLDLSLYLKQELLEKKNHNQQILNLIDEIINEDKRCLQNDYVIAHCEALTELKQQIEKL